VHQVCSQTIWTVVRNRLAIGRVAILFSFFLPAARTIQPLGYVLSHSFLGSVYEYDVGIIVAHIAARPSV
jgi:hypothetical protein